MAKRRPPAKKKVKKETVVPIVVPEEKPSNIFVSIKKNTDDLLSRRPHRSFRRTRKRDYARSLQMPGFFAFTFEVQKTLWSKKRIFLLLVLIYAVLSALLVGTASQATYTTLTSTLKVTSNGIFSGNVGALGSAGLLFASTITSSLSQNLTQIQQVYTAILVLMVWLSTVWLLRNILAGHKVKLRDGLYTSGSPILATFLVSLLLIVQLIPLAIAVIGFGAASESGLLSNGVEGLLFCVAAGLLIILSLYWITSTVFALIIVTLPGMYPYRAIKTAGDIVVGRRVRILMRLLWMAIVVIIFWAIVMIPVILIDTSIKNALPAIQNFPTIPLFLLILSSMTVVWVSSYVYLLYRKVVSDDAAPA
jgi:hypothetical protein